MAWLDNYLAVKAKISHHFPPFVLVLVCVEMWERFSFLSISSLLPQYLKDEMSIPESSIYAINSVIAAISYLLPTLSGVLGDRLFGYRTMMLIGASTIATGHVILFFEFAYKPLLFVGLATLALGGGCYKGSVCSLLGACFDVWKQFNRESGFTIFYVGINFGSFIAAAIIGYLAEVGYNYAFGLAAVGMICGLIIYAVNQSIYMDIDTTLNRSSKHKKFFKFFYPIHILVLVLLLLIPPIFCCIYYASTIMYKNILLYTTFSLILLFALHTFIQTKTPREKKDLTILYIYIAFTMLFFVFEIQLQTLFILFMTDNVRLSYLGVTITPSTIAIINPLAIVVIGFFMSFLTFGGAAVEPLRMLLALLANSICFFELYVGCTRADDDFLVSFQAVAAAILAMSMGEVVMAPIVQSKLTAYAPHHLKGAVVGLHTAALGFGGMSGVLFAEVFAVFPGASRYSSLHIYQHGFNQAAKLNLGFVAAFILCIPILYLLETHNNRQKGDEEDIEFDQHYTHKTLLYGDTVMYYTHHDVDVAAPHDDGDTLWETDDPITLTE